MQRASKAGCRTEDRARSTWLSHLIELRGEWLQEFLPPRRILRDSKVSNEYYYCSNRWVARHNRAGMGKTVIWLTIAASVVGGVCTVLAGRHLTPVAAQTSLDAIGIFEGRTDIGELVHPGVAEYDAASKSYTVRAAGENMWSNKDAFYFLWQKVSGDVELSADVAFPQAGGRAHRKAVLVLKQNLDADGVYADAALHGSGLTALQYRRAKGATTQDIELNIDMPRRVRMVKRGDEITMFLSMHGEPLHQAGASIKLHFADPFYAGIGVCSHNKDTTETAVFSNVELKKPEGKVPADKLVLFSALQTIQTEDNFRRSMVVRTEMGRIGSANWTRDGQTLYFDREGQIEKMAVLGATPELVNIGPHLWCGQSWALARQPATRGELWANPRTGDVDLCCLTRWERQPASSSWRSGRISWLVAGRHKDRIYEHAPRTQGYLHRAGRGWW